MKSLIFFIHKFHLIIYRIFFMPLKLLFLYKKGKNVYIGQGCDLTFDHVLVGNNVYIGPNCFFISPKNFIKIGNNVMFGPNVMVISSNHNISNQDQLMFNLAKNHDLDTGKDINIEDDVWIGSGSIILQGVTIHKGSVVGAGSVVSRDIPPNSVYVGVKPKLIKSRFKL
jgi:acetyltransferase-like isoleucine patch superfamily enzyme